MTELSDARRKARWLIVRTLIGSALLAVAGWIGFGPWDWLDKLLLIGSGLGYGSAMVEADRLWRSEPRGR